MVEPRELCSKNAESISYEIIDGIRCQYGDGLVVDALILRDPGKNPLPHISKKPETTAAEAVDTSEFAFTLSSGFGSLFTGANCPVCLCPPHDDGSNLVVLPCKHVYCSGCYQSWLSGDAHQEFPITCLAEGCFRPLRPHDLASTLVPKDMTKLLKNALDNYVRLNCDRFRWCESPDCSGIIERNEGTSSGICSTCCSSFCFTCHTGHENMSCKEYKLATLPPDRIRMKIVEEILTLRCPRCRTAFLDFHGCFALHCASCDCSFCGWCLKDCNSDAHSHVSSCASKEVGAGQYQGTLEMFHAAQNKRRKKLLLSFLETLSPTDKKQAIDSIQQDLADLGLSIS